MKSIARSPTIDYGPLWRLLEAEHGARGITAYLERLTGYDKSSFAKWKREGSLMPSEVILRIKTARQFSPEETEYYFFGGRPPGEAHQASQQAQEALQTIASALRPYITQGETA